MNEPVIDTCDLGHKFAKLPDYPMKNNKPRCPHCMAIGLDHFRGSREETNHSIAINTKQFPNFPKTTQELARLILAYPEAVDFGAAIDHVGQTTNESV